MLRKTNVRISDVAHGGTCLAHIDGQATFVRGALPGELVDVEVTERTAKIARARVVAVLEASPERVIPDCPVAGRCGGCDWLHTSFAYSRELKRRVVASALHRFAGYSWTGDVVAVAPETGWRTRMTYHEADGEIGLYGYRSHAVVPVPDAGCLAAAPSIARPKVAGPAVAAASGVRWGPGTGTERAIGRDWRVSGFWQVHPRAADTLVAAVLTGLSPRPGESALDLFCGVGLFAGALVDAGCSVVGVEGNRTAVAQARGNVASARFIAGDVARVIAGQRFAPDLVVLDPPRAGAKAKLMAAIEGLRPRAIAYVACDPVALARDLNYLTQYQVTSVQAFDLFPGTHHVETVAVLSRAE